MTTANLTTQLRPSQQPRLPAAPVEYDQRFVDANSSILRQYFNQLDNLTQSLLTNTGGRFFRTPTAAVQRTTNVTFAANTPKLVTFDQTDFSNAVTNDTTDGLRVTYPGIYNYQFSIQWANPDTQIHTAWCWLRVNGVDVPGTGSKFDITAKHGTSDGYIVVAANFFVSLNASDRVEMFAAADSVLPYMEAYAAQTSPFAMPAIPSIVATLTFVSAPLT